LLADGQATERLPRKGKISVIAFAIMGVFGIARLSETKEP
jgi:hypothetical protein